MDMLIKRSQLFRYSCFVACSSLLGSCYSRTEEEKKEDDQRVIEAGIKYSEAVYDENLSKARLKRFQDDNDSGAVDIEKRKLEEKKSVRITNEQLFIREKNECHGSVFNCMIADMMKSDTIKGKIKVDSFATHK